MRERDRLIIKAHREEVAAQEAAEQERVNAPIRKAESALRETHTKLIAVQRENLLNLPDPDIFISPAMQGASMSKADAISFNGKQANLFVQVTPEYLPYKRTDTSDILLSYFERSNVHMFDCEMLTKAFFKLRDLGIITANEIPELVPDTPEPTPVPTSAEPELVDGFDLESGEPRKWTQRELNRLDSTSYRKALRLYKDALALPTRGPGLFGQR